MELRQFADTNKEDRVVLLITNKGTIKIKLFADITPKTVENFLTHAKNNYYNGVIFHRVIKDFMIQGGDPTGTGMGGESIWGKPFSDEISQDLFHFHGALSMANAGPATNGSQFFIVHKNSAPATREQFLSANYPEEAIKKYLECGGTAHLDGRHTVFGQVIAGLDVVDEIANTAVGANDRPIEDVVIQKIEIVN